MNHIKKFKTFESITNWDYNYDTMVIYDAFSEVFDKYDIYKTDFFEADDNGRQYRIMDNSHIIEPERPRYGECSYIIEKFEIRMISFIPNDRNNMLKIIEDVKKVCSRLIKMGYSVGLEYRGDDKYLDRFYVHIEI